MSRRTLLAAVGAIAIAGVRIEQDRDPAVPVRTHPTPSAPAPSPTPRSSPSADVGVEVQAAEKYALAATNWTARTYPRSLQARRRLASGRLALSLRDAAPLHQMRRDQVARLGAVVGRPQLSLEQGTVVRLDVEELHFALGTRSREIVTYDVRLRQFAGRWRVVGFTAVRGGS